MTDRELLELAARANWAREVADDEIGLRYSEADDGMLYLHADNQDHNGCDREFRWNPLAENHDAFALAVKLRLEVEFFDGDGDMWVNVTGSKSYRDLAQESVSDDADWERAARRAIVTAAASQAAEERKS
ncbi:hypothetical protein PIN31009_01861 [Pandoraea iniqua]|nr:hypothetical protein PIN31009_01861 [Pandoraea iniqua]